ncbi:hypothetical protein B0A48_17036 [Cryoendolithus antarcticus]|uniref:RRM domain-containing protein n=1 Tax=Cryoendolithus antarcticus TaxID=1507870 RepID=A0A1V8SBS0_9PEZI|nr:hypothetical protein B0A48_17036 [Cryoendolithus antarcticus]
MSSECETPRLRSSSPVGLPGTPCLRGRRNSDGNLLHGEFCETDSDVAMSSSSAPALLFSDPVHHDPFLDYPSDDFTMPSSPPAPKIEPATEMEIRIDLNQTLDPALKRAFHNLQMFAPGNCSFFIGNLPNNMRDDNRLHAMIVGYFRQFGHCEVDILHGWVTSPDGRRVRAPTAIVQFQYPLAVHSMLIFPIRGPVLCATGAVPTVYDLAGLATGRGKIETIQTGVIVPHVVSPIYAGMVASFMTFEAYGAFVAARDSFMAGAAGSNYIFFSS